MPKAGSGDGIGGVEPTARTPTEDEVVVSSEAARAFADSGFVNELASHSGKRGSSADVVVAAAAGRSFQAERNDKLATAKPAPNTAAPAATSAPATGTAEPAPAAARRTTTSKLAAASTASPPASKQVC